MHKNAFLQQIEAIDTPTLSNAIERLQVRNCISGFCHRGLRYLPPELGRLCGVAVTAEAETMTPETEGGLDDAFVEVCRAIADTPKPAVAVIHEVGAHPEFAARCGEVMAAVFHRLGAVGVVSDGAVRDLPDVRALGLRSFAPGLVASHGSFRLVRVPTPVTICGLRIAPGDLLHGDENGLILVPPDGREDLIEQAEAVRKAEKALLDFVKSEDFSIEKLRTRLVH